MQHYINQREKELLSALYRHGESSISALAKATFINRTTLYPILERLAEKGLVTKYHTTGKILFQAIPLVELESWTQRKATEAKQAAADVLHWAEQHTKQPRGSLLTEIKYFAGLDGVMNLYNDTWRDNQEKTIYALTDYERAYHVVGNEFLRNNYFQQRVAHGVRVKSLLPDSPIGRKDVKDAKRLLRDMRFINLFQDLGIEINVYDDKLALFAFDAEKPAGVLIKNHTIAQAFKHIFTYLWKTARRP